MLRRAAHAALAACEPAHKVAAVHQLARRLDQFRDDEVIAAPGELITKDVVRPGRPARPTLVDPRRVPQRSTATSDGRARLLHAIAHIEFNAINLALDAIWRFADMPDDYYRDWLRVADEEALHFTLVAEHLHRAYGHHYGDFDAHDGLWQMAESTKHDVLARMALVPRILEARGLDVTPGMQDRLRQAGDQQAVEILSIILRDEVGHVAIGNRWFRWLCSQRGVDEMATMNALVREHRAPQIKPPLNIDARTRAGFTADELAQLSTDTRSSSAPAS